MRVIQVGIGGMGNAWLGAVQRSPQVEFAGFVEINLDRPRQSAKVRSVHATAVKSCAPVDARHLEVALRTS